MPRQNQNKKKIVIGLTGGFGSGKSTVARIFKACGAEIIDADQIAHKIIKPGTRIYKRITAIFDKQVLKKNRSIDRRKLGKIVFANKALLGQLNRIMHPEIIRIIRKKISQSKKKIIILDAPLLVEAHLNKITDKLIVVTINRREQLKRLFKKTGLSSAQILLRARRQIPLADKVRIADFVIDNNGTIGNTKNQVTEIRRMLWKN